MSRAERLPKWNPRVLGSRTVTSTRLPLCSVCTSICATSSLPRPRFSTTTSTSGLSHGRTSMDPSKVASTTSGLPDTWKRFSSRST